MNLVAKLRRTLPMYPAGNETKKLLEEAADNIEECQAALTRIKNWYDTDGSVGTLSTLVDEIFN